MSGDASPGLKLIETVLWTGQGAPRWPLHVARLRRSCARLGWHCPGDITLPRPDGPARLRLTLDAGGVIEWTVHDLPAARAPWRVVLAGARLSSADPWLGLKSTRRPCHDAARATLAPGVDEALFLNERDEVCEGTITNVFFDRGDGMRTPPLACGLLPGVLREELACPEEVLHKEELGRVTLWVGNALRGLIPARLIG